MAVVGDDAFLSEVEDFLDSCNLPILSSTQALPSDGHTSADSLPSGGDSIPENCITLAKGVRHRVYRKRRRAEREHLEEEVEELKLKLAKEPRRLLLMSAWRMVATCQLEKRLIAEAQHRQLRSAILAQNTLIRAYEGLVPGQVISVNTLGSGGSRTTYYPPESLRGESFDTEFYKTSARTFDAIYGQAEEVFGALGLDSTNTRCGSSTQELLDENGRCYYQYSNKRQVPFGFRQSCEGLRSTLSHLQQDAQQAFSGEYAVDTVAIKFRASTQLKSDEAASILFRVINRCYQEDERVVVVWRSFAEGEGAFTGMHSDEIGWNILSSSTETPDESIMRLCARYTPMHFGTPAVREWGPIPKTFAGMVVEASTSNADNVARSLDTLRLTDS
ncbi:hypothetical protein ON010_g18016 [Phytophthora cinnamomi]|nr:hypothetical protein ON010_g18016 [Phytophthora cinnamomi]